VSDRGPFAPDRRSAGGRAGLARPPRLHRGCTCQWAVVRSMPVSAPRTRGVMSTRAAIPARQSPWSALRRSHFPDPPNRSLEHCSRPPLDTEGRHERTWRPR
jgi:hypothetical protein